MATTKISVVIRFASFAVVMLLLFRNTPLSSLAKEPDYLHIHLIDVGKGDAMILHQPNSCTILIDAGLRMHADRVINKLDELGLKTLDMVIISHPHDDHFGGLFDILPRYPAAELLDNGYKLEQSAKLDEYNKLRDLQPYSTLTYGDKVQCGNVKINVLQPTALTSLTGTAEKINDNSLVLMISFDDFRLLHMGDLGGNAVEELISKNSDLKAQVIKVAHHGLIDSASKALLKEVSPEHALISSSGECDALVGCSPDQAVLDRLDRLGISYSRTDQDGNVEMIVDRHGFNVTTSSTQ